TGKGVVTGICDIGIDPLHTTFLSADGSPRIRRIVQYLEGDGKRIEMNTSEEFALWQTDTRNEWHATHVAGIMAGSALPYRGMAPEADIVVSTSTLSDVGLLCGAEDIIDYAREEGKRALVNMSMGNYTGPHDGSSLFCQYLDLLAEEAVVVISAGNAGNSACSLPFTFTEDKTTVSLPIYSTDWVQFDPYGMVDVWSRDDTEVSIRFGIRDNDLNETVWMSPWRTMTSDSVFTVTSDSASLAEDENEERIYDPSFAGLFKGYVSITGGIDSENGRFHTAMIMDAHTEYVSERGHWARYILIVEVGGNPGTGVDIYADNQFTVFRQLPGEPAPDSSLSFSDLGTGRNTISVGMFSNRESYPILGGDLRPSGVEPGTISSPSGYATLADGRVMPLTVAPGFGVISAISNPFLESNPGKEPINAETLAHGKRYYWATNYGTSMSAPYVAGTIACWLEAIPSLTTGEIREIILASNRHDYPDPDNPRHGLGWFDPAEGLRVALRKYASGIENLPSAPGIAPQLSVSGNNLTLWNPAGAGCRITLYSASGVSIASFLTAERTSDFPLSDFPPGIYIAAIEGSSFTLKFIIH
ncbi:MAG: S8 family peptidase, partial [Muribaculaceae bacterium]|nr:S8 family peptidase [Muribaculaceae bacterium]